MNHTDVTEETERLRRTYEVARTEVNTTYPEGSNEAWVQDTIRRLKNDPNFAISGIYYKSNFGSEDYKHCENLYPLNIREEKVGENSYYILEISFVPCSEAADNDHLRHWWMCGVEPMFNLVRLKNQIEVIPNEHNNASGVIHDPVSVALLASPDLSKKTFRTSFVKESEDSEYYTGVLTSINNYPEFYTVESVEVLLEDEDSSLRLRLNDDKVFGELGNPRIDGQITQQQAVERIVTIDNKNIAIQISDIWLDKEYGKKHPELGLPHLAVLMGRLKPCGPNAAIAESVLSGETTGRTLLRGFNRANVVSGEIEKSLVSIVTFDLGMF